MVKPKKKTKSTTKTARENAKKHWCFTLNNPTVTRDDLLQTLKTHCSYLVLGDEVGESATPHIQGYIELHKKQRFTTVSLLFAPHKPHLEPKSNNSTTAQAADYCKKDGQYSEFGIPPRAPQKRQSNALKTLCQSLVLGRNLDEVILEDPATYVRNYRGIQDFQQRLITVPKIREMTVHLHFGATGAGKTHYCTATYPNLFKKPIGKALWFDGYLGESVILIDEFVGQYPLSDILQIMDKYETQVERKGSHCKLNNNLLLLTSNTHPSQYYDCWAKRAEQQKAFIRRISKVYHYIARDNVMIYETPEDIYNFCITPLD